MAIRTTYSNARSNFASLLARVTDDREVVIIARRGREDVALISAAELSSLMETAHLFRSPKNVRKLLKAINRVQTKPAKPASIEKLREEFGIAKRRKV